MGRVPDEMIRTKSDEAALDMGCTFDLAAADRVRYFFERFLRHSKGAFAGKKFELFDWQWQDIVAPAFGWKMPDGTRRFRRVGCGVPKKNGKSTLLSGLSLYMLCGDGEAGAEVFSAAASKDQASIIFNEAAHMVEASPALATQIRLRRQAKEMEYLTCFYKALSADVPTKEGLNIHCLLFDELHAQPGWELWNVLRYGFASRRQPMLFWISTAGIYSPESIGFVQWQYARDVIAGKIIDVGFLPVIYEADEKDDWKAAGTFRKANPSYPATISVRDYEEAVKEAQDLPMNENSFKRYRLNIWTRQATKWIPMERWDSCGVNAFTIKKREKVWVGLDLATTTDIAAATLLWKCKDKVRIRHHFWVPEAILERRRKENRTLLDAWVPKWITVVPGDVLRYEFIQADLNKDAEVWRVVEYGIDPWNATQLATHLEDDGFKVCYVKTGFLSISAATKEFERMILAGEIEHERNPVMDWMVANVTVSQDASGNIKPDKSKSSEKIDGVVSTIIAIARAVDFGKPKMSRYEHQGVSQL